MGKSGEGGREGQPGIKVPTWQNFLFCPDSSKIHFYFLLAIRYVSLTVLTK